MYNPPGQELWYLFAVRFPKTKALAVPTLVRPCARSCMGHCAHRRPHSAVVHARLPRAWVGNPVPTPQVEPGEEEYMKRRWTKAAKPSKVPVISLEEAPGAVPVAPAHRALQQYIPFAPTLLTDTELFIRENLPRPYVAVHLRLEEAWRAHCAALSNTEDAAQVAAAQCLTAGAGLRPGLCLPDVTQLQQLVKRAIRRTHAKSVYIATDLKDPTGVDAYELVAEAATAALAELHDVPASDTVVLRMGHLAEDPNVTSVVGVLRDMSVLAAADLAILNCVSSFSSLIAREREVRQRGVTAFWGLPFPAMAAASPAPTHVVGGPARHEEL